MRSSIIIANMVKLKCRLSGQYSFHRVDQQERSDTIQKILYPMGGRMAFAVQAFVAGIRTSPDTLTHAGHFLLGRILPLLLHRWAMRIQGWFMRSMRSGSVIWIRTRLLSLTGGFLSICPRHAPITI